MLADHASSAIVAVRDLERDITAKARKRAAGEREFLLQRDAVTRLLEREAGNLRLGEQGSGRMPARFKQLHQRDEAIGETHRGREVAAEHECRG